MLFIQHFWLAVQCLTSKSEQLWGKTTNINKEKYFSYTKHMDEAQDLSLILFTGLTYESKALCHVLPSSFKTMTDLAEGSVLA